MNIQRIFSEYSAWVERMFNRHKLVRRLLLLWAVWLITTVVLAYTERMGSISQADGVVIGAVIALLSTVLALYQHQRAKDDRDARS